MKSNLITILILSLAVPSFATASPRDCADNFTVDGTFESGRTFKTAAFVPNVSKADAINAAGRDLASVGWQINSTNESMGVISASQVVTYGQGKTAPLNVLVDEANGGVNVSMTYTISGGLDSPVEAVVNQFCTTIGAIADTTY
ncbi:hypothetical protein [Cellvibrio sp. OA-2007]|uniref:hypothetical protein n=1 Tax=Cellvibrio sp. OA-2007 TaxID=529823 RepID=UPI0007816EC2|nr:hypothetical protein [Cellvibrio sp. OA-2007]